MSVSPSGRHCLSCQQNVVDFSVLSNDEILEIINQATGPVCGRLTHAQLNQPFHPRSQPGKTGYWTKLWQMLIAGTFLTSQVKSQVKHAQPMVIQSVLHNNSDTLATSTVSVGADACLLIDATTRQPLAGATILLDNKTIITDSNGVFRIDPFTKKITISYVGYHTLELAADDLPLSRHIALESNIDALDAVTITSPGSNATCGYFMGGLSFSRKVTVMDTLFRRITQWMPNRAVKVFPNPIIRGQVVQVQLSLEKTGAYMLRIFTADGRLVLTQPLSIYAAKQRVPLTIPSQYAQGVYWLVIEGKTKSKKHEVKLVIQ